MDRDPLGGSTDTPEEGVCCPRGICTCHYVGTENDVRRTLYQISGAVRDARQSRKCGALADVSCTWTRLKHETKKPRRNHREWYVTRRASAWSKKWRRALGRKCSTRLPGLCGGAVVGSSHSTACEVPCTPHLPGPGSQGKAFSPAGLVAARRIITQLGIPLCAFGLALCGLFRLNLLTLERLGDVPYSGI